MDNFKYLIIHYSLNLSVRDERVVSKIAKKVNFKIIFRVIYWFIIGLIIKIF
jgi:hypothetical protein